MPSRGLLIVVGSIVLVLAILFVSVAVPFGTSVKRTDPPADALSYAVPGPHPVGMSGLATDAGAPLEIVMWYPTANAENRRARITYPYQIKMGPPLNTVTFATYKGQAIRNAPYDLAAGPYPLIVLSPGLSTGASAYAWLAEHLASYGFVVMAPEHQEQFDPELDILWQTAITRPQDIQAVLVYVDAQAEAGGALEGLIDAETVAVVGHSYGGYTALAMAGAQFDTGAFTATCDAAYASGDPAAWLCDELYPHMADMAELAGLDSIPEGLWPAQSDPRVDAIVPLAGDALFFGQPGLAEITVPVMAIGGTLDTDSPFMWSTHPTYEYASSTRKVRIALHDAEHMVFTGTCEAVPLALRLIGDEFCTDVAWDRYRAHDLTNHFATAFLLAELTQDTGAAAALAPDGITIADVTYEAQGY